MSTVNIPSEMSFVERVRQVFITCGRNATVEQNAASKPTQVSQEISANPFVIMGAFLSFAA